MVIILKANEVNFFVSSVLFVFWYHSPNILDRPHICNISRLRVNKAHVVLDGILFSHAVPDVQLLLQSVVSDRHNARIGTWTDGRRPFVCVCRQCAVRR
jgi:hypothetical protein